MAPDRQQFSELDLLSTPLLEEIIRKDFSGEADYSEDMIQYVLELLANRRKEEHPETLPDVQDAWERLCMKADLPKGKKHGAARILRYAALVAVFATVIFAILIPQALGEDMPGILGSWTNGAFSFHLIRTEQTTVLEDFAPVEGPLGELAAEVGLPTSLIPRWIPEGYEVYDTDSFYSEVWRTASVGYLKPGGRTVLLISIEEYFDPEFLSGGVYMKDAVTPELYMSKGKEFYLFTNAGSWTAVWSDGVYGITIGGADSRETIIAIIESIP